MLTHKITPYKESRWHTPSYRTGDVPILAPPSQTEHRGTTFFEIDSKVGYAQYVGHLEFEPGDWAILTKTLQDAWPPTDDQFVKVDSIQELHYQAHWDRTRKLPMCLRVIRNDGMALWVVPNDYHKCTSVKPTEAWGKKK